MKTRMLIRYIQRRMSESFSEILEIVLAIVWFSIHRMILLESPTRRHSATIRSSDGGEQAKNNREQHTVFR